MPKNITYLPTTEAYDRWAKVYDSDGNFLQALDTIEMRRLLPEFLDAIEAPKPWRLVDLGCGTGRNTALLLAVDDAASQVVALDASRGMLDVARSRLAKSDRLTLADFDLLDATCELPAAARDADGVVSTLVVEHIPLSDFFSGAARTLRPGGVLLVTNMHADMGAISQAGFVDGVTGDKIRPKSYSHATRDVVAEAARWGFELVGRDRLDERAVREDMVDELGPRSRKWVGVTCWFGGVFRKRVTDDMTTS